MYKFITKTDERNEYLYGSLPESRRRWECGSRKYSEWIREGELKPSGEYARRDCTLQQ